MLNNMRVGTKIILLVAVLLCCMITIAIVGIIEMRAMDLQSNKMYENNFLGLQAAKEANIQLINVSRTVRNITLVPSEVRHQYIEAYGVYADRTLEELKKLRGLLLTPAGLAAQERVVKAVEDYLPRNREFINKVGSLSQAEIFKELSAIRDVGNTADKYMTELGTMLAAAAQSRNQTITELADSAYIISAVILAVALLVAGILGTMIKKAIANPLVEIAGKATQVAAGDLNQDFAMDRRDELGVLATALAQMVTNLRERIAEAEQKSREAAEQSQAAAAATNDANAAKEKAEEGRKAIVQAAKNVEQVVNRLSAATEELSAQVEQCSRGTEMQRDRVSSSATAMEEMNSTVLEVARNAGIAAEGSERAKEKAHQGEVVVRESVDAINAVQTDTLELKKNMEGLGRQAEAIGTIMTVISDIADQTNLLALNAAIEAARAGEAGRGFAVVADEVRKLAEKTMNATKEVGQAIKGIQNGTRVSISAVERTTGNLDVTTDLVKKSGAALAEIVQEVVHAADQVRNIAAAAEEQSAASDEITHSLDEINRMADETATAMQQSSQAVSELAEQSQELQRLVNDLRND